MQATTPEIDVDRLADVVRHAGFDAYSVAGGTSGWTRSGRPVVAGHAPCA